MREPPSASRCDVKEEECEKSAPESMCVWAHPTGGWEGPRPALSKVGETEGEGIQSNAERAAH